MGIRETINENPGIVTGITGGIILIVLIIIGMQFFGSNVPPAPNRLYYTVDDGANWFADRTDRLPPFEHNGQTAYRVHVYTCDDGATAFVSHLERYTPEAKATLERLRNEPQDPSQPRVDMQELMMTGVEVKKPNDPNAPWVNRSTQQGDQIATPLCPDGTQQGIRAVVP